MRDSFQVNIISLKQGCEEIKDVKILRLKSKDYNLLIMKDYVPIIGLLEGSFEIVTSDQEIKVENVLAYYINQNNVFHFIIKEQL